MPCWLSTSPGRAGTGGPGLRGRAALHGPGASSLPTPASPSAEGLTAIQVAPEPPVPTQPQPRTLACTQGGSPPLTRVVRTSSVFVLGSCPVHPLDVSSTPHFPQVARAQDLSQGVRVPRKRLSQMRAALPALHSLFFQPVWSSRRRRDTPGPSKLRT